MSPPLFFLLASLIQDVITSKIGRGVVLKIIRRPFLKGNWRRMVLTRTRHRQPVRDPDFEFAPSLLYQLGKQIRICGIGDERCPATIFLRHTVRAIDGEPASLCRGCLRYSDVAIIISRDGSNR